MEYNEVRHVVRGGLDAKALPRKTAHDTETQCQERMRALYDCPQDRSLAGYDDNEEQLTTIRRDRAITMRQQAEGLDWDNMTPAEAIVVLRHGVTYLLARLDSEHE